MAGDREKCLAAGCDEYATKPIDRQRLIELIWSLVLAPAAS
jgi:CheY-like chemotaxis protein